MLIKFKEYDTTKDKESMEGIRQAIAEVDTNKDLKIEWNELE